MSEFIKKSKEWREYFDKNPKEFSNEFPDSSGEERNEWKEIAEILNFISQKNAYDRKITSLLYDNGGLEDFFVYHTKNEFSFKLRDFILFSRNLLENEDDFEEYQAKLFEIKPTAAIIKRLYKDKIVELLQYDEFEKTNKRAYGNYLPELLGLKNNELDTYDISILNDCIKNRELFFRYAPQKQRNENNWKIFKKLKPVFIDKKTKENYDRYYRFLCCKSLLRNILIQSKTDEYKGEEVELEWYKHVELAIRDITLENENKIADLIQEFCEKVGLLCTPISDVDWERYNNDERGDYKAQLDAKIKELEELKAKAIPLLDKINTETTDFLSLNGLSYFKSRKEALEKCKTAEFIKKELKEISNIFDSLETTLQKIVSAQIECRTVQEFVKKSINEAIAKYNQDSVNKNVRGVLDYVKSQFDKAQSKYNDFIYKYGDKYFSREQKRFKVLEEEFKKKETGIRGKIEK